MKKVKIIKSLGFLCLLSSIILISFLSCTQDFAPGSLDPQTLAGSTEEDQLHFVYEYNDAEQVIKKSALNADDELQWYITYTYNDAGTVSEKSKYDAEDVKQWTYSYEYGEAGKKVKESYFDGDDALKWYLTFTYDEIGKLAEKSSFDAEDNLQWMLTYEYDESGSLVKESAFNSSEELTAYDTYSYDLEGRLIKRTHYESDPPGTEETALRVYYITYTYDESGRTAEEEKYTGPEDPGELEYKLVYDYDTEGGGYYLYRYAASVNLIRRSRYEAGDLLWEYRYTFEEGNLSEKSAWFYGILLYTNTYTYDEDGLMTGVTTTGSEGTVKFSYSLLYDESGNLLTAEIRNGDELLLGYYEMVYGTEENRTVETETETTEDPEAEEEPAERSRINYYAVDAEGTPVLLGYWVSSVENRLDEFDGEDAPVRSFIFEKDEENRTIKISCVDTEEAELWYYQFEYDEEGNRIREEKISADGEVLSSSTFEFDFIFDE
ncbi:MAG: hypothetical protein ACLFSE_13330 [Spirochaetia bacterium]